MKLQTLPIFLVFFLMGLADAMGPMSDGVKEHYHLNHVAATLLPFFVFIAFAACSVPAGLLAGRIGKKNLLLLGLALNTLAVLVASFPLGHYEVLLCCIFLLGVGTTLLQVAGNPVMRNLRRCRKLQPQSQLCARLQRHRQHGFHVLGWGRDGIRSACGNGMARDLPDFHGFDGNRFRDGGVHLNQRNESR